MTEPSRNVAVFIDAENTGAQFAKTIMEHARSLGRVAFARIYGKAAQLTSWESAMKEHGIRSMPTPAAATKKNASDFALTIDAVGTLHDIRYDHALIVSKDGDFLQLVMHIKESGARVTCAGESHAAASLRKHCDGWLSLTKEPAKTAPAAKAQKVKAVAPAKAGKDKPAPAVKMPREKAGPPAKAAEPKVSGRSKIDVAVLKRHFEDFAASHPEGVDRDGFVKFLGEKMRGAKKGYGTWQKFLEELALFVSVTSPGLLKLKS